MKTIISGILIILLPIFMIAQDLKTDSKVLIKELQGEYKGKTKKGLAHGQGIAQGTDTYQGNFKKGLPNGEGKYIWSTGEAYDGKWVNGNREGFGKYFFTDENGQESFIEGYWVNDSYLGKERNDDQYKVQLIKNIERVSVKRRGNGNKVSIKYLRAGNNSLNSIKDLRYSFDSGTEFSTSSVSGIENIEFPFTFTLYFDAPSKFRKMTNSGEEHKSLDIQRSAEINLLTPGSWDISITF